MDHSNIDEVIGRTTSKPRLKLGVISDIQYAPILDGTSYSGTPRFYRHALEVAKHAFDHYQEERVDLVVNLGDTIDGKCQDIARNGGEPIPEGADPGLYSLEKVLQAISRYQHGKVLHTYGNHCLYNLSREALQMTLGIDFTEEPNGELVGYYSHEKEDIRLVVIDGYDIAMMKRCPFTSPKRKEAVQILQENNPNFETNINSPQGLEGVNRRFVGFNGSVGALQLEWLRETLEDARSKQQKVVILSHQPIHPDSSSTVCLIWNYDEVLAILREFSDVVVLSLCGHAHQGGYWRDEESGIHFRVIEAALENRPERTYAILDVHDDRFVLRGFGNCESAIYDFEHLKNEVSSLPRSSSR